MFYAQWNLINNFLNYIYWKKNEGLRKFEADIGQLISNEETDEKIVAEKAIEAKELQQNKVYI